MVGSHYEFSSATVFCRIKHRNAGVHRLDADTVTLNMTSGHVETLRESLFDIKGVVISENVIGLIFRRLKYS
jgi:hypothetical protein